jgi:hypothetical protein
MERQGPFLLLSNDHHGMAIDARTWALQQVPLFLRRTVLKAQHLLLFSYVPGAVAELDVE